MRIVIKLVIQTCFVALKLTFKVIHGNIFLRNNGFQNHFEVISYE